MFPLELLGPSGLGDPYDSLLDPFDPPPIAFWSKGLGMGENGIPERFPPFGLPFFDSGDSE